MLKLFQVGKGLLLLFPIQYIFLPCYKGLLFLGHFIKMTTFIRNIDQRNLLINDFYSFTRNHSKRYEMYTKIAEAYRLFEGKIIYLEFGVSTAHSFKWWLAKNTNADSKFYGFDTFEGLPEDWGGYSKGAMAAGLPDINDPRASFVKGLFQDTLIDFIAQSKSVLSENSVRVLHLDADLYSSTLFCLTTLFPFIRKGDILLFDEFNVPMHEFKAFSEFVESFYIKLKPIGAVNNYYQMGFIVE